MVRSIIKYPKHPFPLPQSEHWVDIVSHREAVLLEDFEIFQDYWVVTEREQGLSRLQVQRWDGTEAYTIPVEGETYSLSGGYNPSFNTTKFRYGFASLKTPSTLFEFDMATQTQQILKQREVVDTSFDPDNYIEKRVWALSRDGVQIPISLVHHKDVSHSSSTLCFYTPMAHMVLPLTLLFQAID